MKTWPLFLTINKGNAFWRKLNIATVFVVIAFMVIAISLGTLEYNGFKYFLLSMNESPELKPIVVGFTLQAFFLILFLLSIASAFFISPYLFLKNRDNAFLLSMPIEISTIFHARFLQQMSLTIWTGIVFGLPAIIAINHDLHLNPLFYLSSFLLFIFLIIIGNSLSNILLLLLYPLIQKISTRIMLLVQILLVFLLGYAAIATISPRILFNTMENQGLTNNSQIFQHLIERFHFWPSSWFVQSAFSSIFNTNTLNYSLIIIIILSVILVLQHFLASIFYRPILQRLQQGSSKNTTSNKLFLSSKTPLILILREWLQIRRTRADLSHFVLFTFIFFIYVGMLFQAPAITDKIDPVWTPRLIVFIVLTIGYFITLIALRFGFPFASSEKQFNWLNLTYPLNRCCAFNAHVISIFIPTLILIETVILLTTYALHLNVIFTVPMLILTPVLSLATITISTALGVFFQVNLKSNSEAISTTPAGLATLAFCFAYITLSALALWPELTKMTDNNTIGINTGLYYYGIIFLSLLITMLFWHQAKRKYNRFYI